MNQTQTQTQMNTENYSHYQVYMKSQKEELNTRYCKLEAEAKAAAFDLQQKRIALLNDMYKYKKMEQGFNCYTPSGELPKLEVPKLVRSLAMTAEEAENANAMNLVVQPVVRPMTTIPENTSVPISGCGSDMTHGNWCAYEVTDTDLSNRMMWNQQNNVKPKPYHLCGDFFYRMCVNPKCNRVHTRVLEKMRIYLNNDKFKMAYCKKNTSCKNYMCNFIHTPDVYMYTDFDGTKKYKEMYWKDGSGEYHLVDEQYVSRVVEEWEQSRHVEWLKLQKGPANTGS